jgi:hypothetical protein
MIFLAVTALSTGDEAHNEAMKYLLILDLKGKKFALKRTNMATARTFEVHVLF